MPFEARTSVQIPIVCLCLWSHHCYRHTWKELHPCAFPEILSIYQVPVKQRCSHIVFLWPIPIDKVCLVCVTPPLANLSAVPETEKAIAGQKHALNAVENKSLSLVSMGTVKLFRRGTMVTKHETS